MLEKAKRLFWLIAGHCLLVMGIIISIPFIFLASACYARGSAKLHHALRNNRFVGDAIISWEDRHEISLRAKLIATGSLTLSVISATLFISFPWLKAVIYITAVSVACFILSRATAK